MGMNTSNQRKVGENLATTIENIKKALVDIGNTAGRVFAMPSAVSPPPYILNGINRGIKTAITGEYIKDAADAAKQASGNPNSFHNSKSKYATMREEAAVKEAAGKVKTEGPDNSGPTIPSA